MKLYYAPGSCALSPHIVAREAGLPVELSRVTFNGAERTTAGGENFFEVNPRGGYVPALRLDDGAVLVEGPAIILYLADQAPGKNLAPEKSSQAWYELISWIAFISSELHKGFSPLFRADLAEDERQKALDKLLKRLAVLEAHLAGKQYILGDAFSVADAYAYAILRWAPKRASVVLSEYPNLFAFARRMEAREGVKTALTEEELEPLVVPV